MSDGSDWRAQAPPTQPPYWETPIPASPPAWSQPAWSQPAWAAPVTHPVAPRRRLRTFLIVATAVIVVGAGSAFENAHNKPGGAATAPSGFVAAPVGR